MLCLWFSRSNFNNTQHPNIFLKFWFQLKLLLQSWNGKSIAMPPLECLEHIYIWNVWQDMKLSILETRPLWTTRWKSLTICETLWKFSLLPKYVILYFDDTLLNFLKLISKFTLNLLTRNLKTSEKLKFPWKNDFFLKRSSAKSLTFWWNSLNSLTFCKLKDCCISWILRYIWRCTECY